MARTTSEIDIRESKLRQAGNLLDILLADRTTGKNIIWATDSYEKYGSRFAPDKQITPELITGKYDKLIQPRAAKGWDEQQKRTKEKAEVFTPLTIVDQMNKSIESSGKFRRITKTNWQEYVQQVCLEITCGEGPFIVSRYDPTAHTGELISLVKRVGFLDMKMKMVTKYCGNKKDWLFGAKEAFKASYGYEWQGDNVLLARENLLYTFIDYYEDKFKRSPTLRMKEQFAEIISWNIFQMDGLKYVVPMSCKIERKNNNDLFGHVTEIKYQCEGCKYKQSDKHNGKYVRIMDWNENKVVRFAELTS